MTKGKIQPPAGTDCREEGQLKKKLRRFLFPMKVFLALTGLYLLFKFAGLTQAMELLPSVERSHGATLGISLLLFSLDPILPVPATAVAYANGHGLGVFLGSIANTVGVVIGSAVAYALGRYSGAADVPSLNPEPNKPLSRSLLWIFATRWVPLASETVAIVSGRRRIPLVPFLIASLFGAIPPGILFAYLGFRSGF